jgi:hypothetical protein
VRELRTTLRVCITFRGQLLLDGEEFGLAPMDPFVLPGFAKFVVIEKAATKARKGINPLTKEPTVFKAKPARKFSRVGP